ncbi:MAG: lipoate--protein ligase family protein [Planctomycetes bacterium]|nr:lipoate--protein ligase family protein [Planctomycetota bacterium]MCC7171639.1 lipoate--protein ligase family protein [Planctomycetota bacterium]
MTPARADVAVTGWSNRTIRPVRLIRSGPCHPFLNMALDEALAATPPTLRFYAFQPFGLSLGYFQDAADFDDAWLAAREFVAVRRATGGSAIAHAHDVTFSIVSVPDAPWFAGDVKTSYARIHAGIARGLRHLGVSAVPRDDGAARSDSGRSAEAICFYKATSFDLVADGRKLVGSAQRRTPGRVLHHGSIPIARNVLAPDAACLVDLLGRTPTPTEVEDALLAGFADELGWTYELATPSATESDRADELVRLKYGTTRWNRDRIDDSRRTRASE